MKKASGIYFAGDMFTLDVVQISESKSNFKFLGIFFLKCAFPQFDRNFYEDSILVPFIVIIKQEIHSSLTVLQDITVKPVLSSTVLDSHSVLNNRLSFASYDIVVQPLDDDI